METPSTWFDAVSSVVPESFLGLVCGREVKVSYITNFQSAVKQELLRNIAMLRLSRFLVMDRCWKIG